MSILKNKYIVPIAAFVAVAFWASAFPSVRYCLRVLSPESILLYRFLVASAILTVYAVIMKIKLPQKGDILIFALAGFLGVFLYMLLFNIGINFVPSGVGGFIIASAPVFTLILSVIFLKERVNMYCWIGVFVSFAGLLIIAANQGHGLKLNVGVALLVAAALCTSFFNVLQRKILKKYSPMQVTTYEILFATVFMLIFLPNLIGELPKVPLKVNLVMLYLGSIPAVVSYLLWNFALSLAKKTIHVTAFLYLSPFISALLGFLWLGETFSMLSFVGGIIIISGMVVTNVWGK